MYRNLTTVFLVLYAFPCLGETYRLYYLGGQSNMDGYGHVSELPDDLGELQDVWIFHGNTKPDGQPVDGRGIWSPLQPGHGRGFRSDGKTNQYTDRFGVEISLAQKLKKLYPGEKIAFIKYSRGGTSIAIDAARQFGCWDSDYKKGNRAGKGVNQYDHFLATVRHAMSPRDIDGDEKLDNLVPAGIVWMQGESDAAATKEIALAYEANLKRLMDLIRAALWTDDLPVVIGRISDSGQDGDGKVWDFGTEVRQAQANFCDTDGNAKLVRSTDNYGYSDKWHYDSKGYLDLGGQFAEALKSLDRTTTP